MDEMSFGLQLSLWGCVVLGQVLEFCAEIAERGQGYDLDESIAGRVAWDLTEKEISSMQRVIDGIRQPVPDWWACHYLAPLAFQEIAS